MDPFDIDRSSSSYHVHLAILIWAWLITPYSESLKPLLEACEESDIFQRRIDAWLEERQLKSHVKKTKRDVKAQIHKEIEGLELDELKETANNVLGEGLFRKSKWSKDRTEGARGVNTRFQNFSAKMARFLEANEVILELVKAAGEPYATAAYGIMSLLFIVRVLLLYSMTFV